MNSYLSRFVWIFIPFFFLQAKSYAYITHSGGSVSGTWAANTTHYIASPVDVPDNLTLTIEPGCVIKFALNARITVIGTLTAAGSAGAKIVFTSCNDDSYGEVINGSSGSPQRGDWDAILAYGSYSYNYEGTVYLDSCIIRYGGGSSSGNKSGVYFTNAKGGHIKNSTVENCGSYGVQIEGSYPTIFNDTVRNCGSMGLYVHGVNTNPSVTGNVFLSNTSYAAYFYDVSLQSYSGNRGSGNGYNGIGVGGTIDGSKTWRTETDFPFIVISQVSVSDNSTLTLAPGTVIKFASQQQMVVYGTLNAAGKADSNIVFTSLKDDTWGGDTDGDGGYPAAGDWFGIQLIGSYSSNYEGTGNFEYCRVRYGGNSASGYSANLYFNNAKGGKFETSVCEYSANYGLHIITSYPAISGATVRNCGNHGLLAHEANTTPSINNNSFVNNIGYGVYIYGTSLQSYSGNTGSGNVVNGFGLGGSVDVSRTWRMGSGTFPFIAITGISVGDNDTLTLPPGTILKFTGTAQLYVNGTLNAAGKSDSLIVFTSLKDDKYGGNTDGENGSPAAGDWYGIQLVGSYSSGYEGTGLMDYCRIRYSGNAGSGYNSGLYFSNSVGGNFRYGAVEYSASHGIQVIASYPSIVNDTVKDCGWYGLYVHEANTNPSILNNTFLNNVQYAVYVYGTSLQSYSGNTGSGNGVNGFALGGSVDGNRTWRMGNSSFPFIALGSITVRDNFTLTLPPGTVLKFTSTAQLYVNGTLNAAGKSDSLIVFTSLKDDEYGGNTDGENGSPAAGDWYGIQLVGSYSSGYEGTGLMEYCRIRYSGNAGSGYNSGLYFSNSVGGNFRYGAVEYSGTHGIQIITSYPSIVNDTVKNCGWYGLYVHEPNTNPSVQNNTFLNNAQYAVYFYGTSLQSYSGNTGSGNGVNGFALGGSVDGNRTWSCGSATFPFVAIAQISVADNYTLTLSPGTIIKFAASTQMYINGTLLAVGTADSNIVFTSLKDDAYGGNTDGNNGNPAPGDWYGIQVIGSYSYNWEGTADFYYCRVRYGGNTASGYGANVYFNQAKYGAFYNGFNEFSARDGINLILSFPSIRYNTFANNSRFGIFVEYNNTNPSIQYNIFTANGSYGAYINTDNLQDYAGNTGSSNGNNSIGVMGTVAQNRTWSSADRSFTISLMGTVSINSGATLNISAGMLDCNTNYISGSGTFALNTGAALGIGAPEGIYSSSGTGNIRNTGGRNFSSSAIYLYKGTGTQYTGNGIPSPLYGVLEVKNSSGLILQKPMDVYGVCALTAGTLNLGSYALNIYGSLTCDTNTVSGTGNFTLNNGAVITIGSAAGIAGAGSTGNIQNSGTRSFSADAKYAYAGRTAQFTGSGLPATTARLVISNSNDVTLSGSVSVSDTLYLTAGGLKTGAYTLSTGISSASPGVISLGTGRIIGNIKRWVPSVKLQTVSFPIGTTSNYRTADVTFTSAPAAYGSITASFTAANPGTAGLPLPDNSFVLGNCGTNGYWTLTAGDGLSGGTYNLDLTAEAFGGVRNVLTLRIIRRQQGGNWTLNGTHADGTGTISSPVIHRTGMTDFSEFGIGGGADNPLGAKVLNLNALIHGFYRTETGTMVPDTISAYLRNAAAPYSMIDSTKGVLSTNGSVTLNFENASNEVNYYLVLKHRNALETWSAAGTRFSSYQMHYNFTDAADKAYGNNLVQKGTKWCIYNGDLNQDGIVDYTDLAIVDNDSYNYVAGYVVSDVTGDDFVDYSDLSIVDNNQFNFVSVVSPLTAKRPVVMKQGDAKPILRSPSSEE